MSNEGVYINGRMLAIAIEKKASISHSLIVDSHFHSPLIHEKLLLAKQIDVELKTLDSWINEEQKPHKAYFDKICECLPFASHLLSMTDDQLLEKLQLYRTEPIHKLLDGLKV